MLGVADLVKIDQIHCRNHVSDQRDLSDLRLATHGSGHCYGAGLERQLVLPGVVQSGCQEPAAHSNVPSALTAEGTNGLGNRRAGAGIEGRHARQPVMGRPLPGSPRDQGIAPDVAATRGSEHEPVELLHAPGTQCVTQPPVDYRKQLRLGTDGS